MSWILPSRYQKSELPIGQIRVVVQGKEVARTNRLRDPVNAKYNDKRQAWLEANKDKIREYDRQYFQKNRKRINAKNRRRYRENPARRAYLIAKQRQYRAMKEKQQCTDAQFVTTT